MLVQIQATVVHRGYMSAQQIPTFHIDSNGGDISHALTIAQYVVNPRNDAESVSMTTWCEETGEYHQIVQCGSNEFPGRRSR